MRLHLCLLVGAAAALLGVSGCATSIAESAPTQKTSGLSPGPSPKERLDEERMEQATKGLVFESGLIRSSTSRRDIAKGETLRLNAERVTQELNTWFVSVGAFRDAILADPANVKSFEGLGRAFLMEGEAKEALAAFATAVKLDPKFSAARYQLGMVKQMGSDYAGAVSEWKTLTQTDPGYRDAFARMAIASYYAQDFTSAWNYLHEADKRHQDVPPQFRDLLKEADTKP